MSCYEKREKWYVVEFTLSARMLRLSRNKITSQINNRWPMAQCFDLGVYDRDLFFQPGEGASERLKLQKCMTCGQTQFVVGIWSEQMVLEYRSIIRHLLPISVI